MPVGHVHLVHEKVMHLSHEEYARLRRLNFGEQGSMRDMLEWCRGRSEDDEVVYLVDQTGTVIAWALIWSTSRHRTAYFYTRAKERRRGFATQIASYIETHYGTDLHVVPHDECSRAFFGKFNFRDD